MFLSYNANPFNIQRVSSKQLKSILTDKDISSGGRIKQNMVLFKEGPVLAHERINEGEEIPWTFSTADFDRHDEVIDQEGWELDMYKNNPVILWAHNHLIPAIGIAKDLKIEGTLGGNILFNDKSFDPFGWAIGERAKRGIITAGSVGFRPLEISIEKVEDEEVLFFRKQELLEFSICNVPANPFALQEPKIKKKKKKSKNEEIQPDFWGGMMKLNLKMKQR